MSADVVVDRALIDESRWKKGCAGDVEDSCISLFVGSDLKGIPAVTSQVRPYVFEVIVPHVFDAEDVDVRVIGDTFSDVGVEAEREFLALLLRFGQMDNLCAL